jgi:hypothetical protein
MNMLATNLNKINLISINIKIKTALNVLMLLN